MLLVSNNIYNRFPGALEGKRRGKFAMYLHNEKAYMHDNTNKTFITLNEVDFPDANSEFPKALLTGQRLDVDKPGAILEMSNLGRKLFNIQDSPTDEPRGTVNATKKWLYNVDVDTNCKFIVYKNKAVLLANAQEFYSGRPDFHSEPNETNSGMNICHEMMRVTVGDYDYSQMNTIIQSANYDPKSDAASMQRNSIVQVGELPIIMTHKT